VLARFHAQVTTAALSRFFSSRPLRAIIRANLAQDSRGNLLRHPEIHFDNCLFEAGLSHIERLRGEVAAERDTAAMWRAFGALTHTAQDFYSHSNYCQLWIEAHGGYGRLTSEEIDALDPAFLNHAALLSGYAYLPRDLLYLLPGQSIIQRLFPPRPDSHAAMHLDNPSRGPAFQFSLVAAGKRTLHEYRSTCEQLSPDQLHQFHDLS